MHLSVPGYFLTIDLNDIKTNHKDYHLPVALYLPPVSLKSNNTLSVSLKLFFNLWLI